MNTFSIWNPFVGVDELWHNRLASALGGESELSAVWSPVVDIEETDTAYLISAELPGIDNSTLDIIVDEGVLRIAADTNAAAPPPGADRLLRQERIMGRFVRELRLGTGIVEANISAEYRDGIVLLTLPKTAEVQPKKVDVKIH